MTLRNKCKTCFDILRVPPKRNIVC